MNTEELKSIENSLELIKQGIAGIETLIRNATQPPDSSSSKLPNNYSHLLPEGYEFCAEGEREKWVKVEFSNKTETEDQARIGYISEDIKRYTKDIKATYRPIRKIQTASYQVDWSNAPEWADVHCFDASGKGYWYGVMMDFDNWCSNWMESNYCLPAGLDWKLSKTFRPR